MFVTILCKLFLQKLQTFENYVNKFHSMQSSYSIGYLPIVQPGKSLLSTRDHMRLQCTELVIQKKRLENK